MSLRLHSTIFAAFVVFCQICSVQPAFCQSPGIAETAGDSTSKSTTAVNVGLDQYLTEQLGFNQAQTANIYQNISHVAPERIQTILEAIQSMRQDIRGLGNASRQRFYVYNRNTTTTRSDVQRFASRIYASPQIAEAAGRKTTSSSMLSSRPKLTPYQYVFRNNGEIGLPGYHKYRRPESTVWSYLVDERSRVLGIDRNIQVAQSTIAHRQRFQGSGYSQTLTSRAAGVPYSRQTATLYSRLYNRPRFYTLHW